MGRGGGGFCGLVCFRRGGGGGVSGGLLTESLREIFC